MPALTCVTVGTTAYCDILGLVHYSYLQAKSLYFTTKNSITHSYFQRRPRRRCLRHSRRTPEPLEAGAGEVADRAMGMMEVADRVTGVVVEMD